jgi:hypothetical protein
MTNLDAVLPDSFHGFIGRVYTVLPRASARPL